MLFRPPDFPRIGGECRCVRRREIESKVVGTLVGRERERVKSGQWAVGSGMGGIIVWMIVELARTSPKGCLSH